MELQVFVQREDGVEIARRLAGLGRLLPDETEQQAGCAGHMSVFAITENEHEKQSK